jgi:eukaryotic-like serine/threonine-protein kinase
VGSRPALTEVRDVFRLVGTTLAGTFQVEDAIAEGGYGVVYRAEHVAFRAPVALKCLKIPGTISPSRAERLVESFREEAEILFHLSAQIPEVVRPLHADAMTLDDGTFVPYIAMEWVDGKPLDSIVILREQKKKPPLSLREVVRMLTPIAHALSRAHRFQVPGGGIVSITHCDMKPENILITEEGAQVRAKILDFGIAKVRDMMRQNVGRMTESEVASPFTPSYGAPEQWLPKCYGQSGPWTDVWGLALTMVECLTGQPPVDGDMHQMMASVLDVKRRPSPRSEGAELDDAVEEVFQQALAVDPRERFNTVEEFWTTLEGQMGRSSSFARSKLRRGLRTYDDESLDSLKRAAKDAAAGSPSAKARADDALRLESRPPGPPASSASEFNDPLDFDFNEGALSSDASSSGPLSSAEEFDIPVSSRGGSGVADLAVGLSTSFELDDAPITSSKPKPSLAQSQHVAASTSQRFAKSNEEHAKALAPSQLRSRFLPAVLLLMISVALTVADMLLRGKTSGLMLGPVRLKWISVAMAASGFLLSIVVFGRDSDTAD